MTQLPLVLAIPRFKGNEERIDLFTNGTASQTWTTSGGVVLPTLAKFIADNQAAFDGSVRFNVAQSLSEPQKEQARINIGIDLDSLELKSLKINTVNDQYGLTQYLKNNLARWNVGITNNTDADFFVHSFNDDGSFKEIVLEMDRQTGDISHKGGKLKPANLFEVNPLYYGADPTGVIDSTAAFNAAISAGTDIHITKGTYKLSEGYNFPKIRLRIDNDVTFIKPDGTPNPSVSLDTLWIGNHALEANSNVDLNGIVQFPTFDARMMNTVIDTAANTAGERSYKTMYTWYNRMVSADNPLGSYAPGNASLSGYIHYGDNSGTPGVATAGGSVGNFLSRINVFSSQNHAIGRNEITPISTGIVCLGAGPHHKLNLYHDFVVSGPQDMQESFLSGASFAVKKLHGGQVADADHEGSHGINIVTNPTIGGFGSPIVTNYPLNVGVAVAGWSGDPSIVTDAYHASATSGFQWGIFVGGKGGNWSPAGAGSRIDQGIGVKDYVNVGLSIFTAHPHATNPYAIKTYPDGGKVAFCIDPPNADIRAHIGNGNAQFSSNMKLYGSTHSTSERSSIDFNNRFLLMTDTAGNDTKDFAVYNLTNGINSIHVSETNKVTIYNLVFGTVFTPANTADTNGVVREIVADANYIYVKTAAGWKRTALAAF